MLLCAGNCGELCFAFFPAPSLPRPSLPPPSIGRYTSLFGLRSATSLFLSFGELKSAIAGGYKLDAYFYNGGCTAGQRGVAQVYRGSFSISVAPGTTKTPFSAQMQLPNVAADAAVAFTATDSNGNTSELGECFPISQATLFIDDIFKNGYEVQP